MGAYISVSQCRHAYNVTLNCNETDTRYDRDGNIISVAGISKGQFQADPDIAGIGIVSTFIAVTGFALALSCLHLLWSIGKCWRKWKYPEYDTMHSNNASLSLILEKVIMACSDQQIFTGGAYALTLRYWKGCTVSAYHYNIVSNMLLLSCATHLMTISLCRQYWKYWWVAWVRILVMTGLFIVTGLMLSNQNATDVSHFPTDVPPADETYSPLFLPAACFQSNSSDLISTLNDSFDGGAKHFGEDVVVNSSPSNRVNNWNFFILIMLFYAAAIVVQVAKVAREAFSKRPGRTPLSRGMLRNPRTFPVIKWVIILYGLYQFCGIGLSFAAVAFSARYIMRLREWVYDSGWLELDNGKVNAENDPTSFGQLVPIFLCILILFTILETVNEEVYSAWRAKREHTSPHGDVEVVSNSTSTLPEQKPFFSVTSSPELPTPSVHDFQPLFPSPYDAGALNSAPTPGPVASPTSTAAPNSAPSPASTEMYISTAAPRATYTRLSSHGS